MTSYQHAARERRHVWRWVWLAVTLVIVVFVALLAWDAVQLRESSQALKVHAAAAQQAVTDRDADALAEEVVALQIAADEFAGATTGPHWWVANHIPWLKNQTLPLTQAGESVQHVAEGALAPIAQMGTLDALEVPAIVDGRIDPYVLEPYRDTLAEAAGVMNHEVDALAAVEVTSAVELVRQPFLELRAELEGLAQTIQGGHVAAEVLPTMLGAEGERTYLVMVQNNAEPRTTGGIAGAVLKVTVNDGNIELEQFATAGEMVTMDGVDFDLTEDELNNFTGRMIKYPQDVNFTPEFPRAAQIMRQFWLEEFGETADGVLSLDPVALGYMLAEMPPTDIDGVTVTGDNLSQVMLNESYFIFPEPADQDVFFALAAGTLFEQLLNAGPNAIAGTERAIEERRFLAWSSIAEEQELLQTTQVAGAFLQHTNTLGLFINDGSGSKIGYYIDADTEVTDHLCTDGSVRSQTVTMTLTHTFSGNVAELPWYVSGGGLFVPEGEFHANILIYPETGLGVTSLTRDGEPAGLHPSVHDGRTLGTARIELVPGQSTTLVYELEASQHGLLPSDFAQTPGPKPHVYTRTVDNAGEAC